MLRNKEIRMCLAVASSWTLIGMAGCDNPKPAESAGRKIDHNRLTVSLKG